MSDFREHYKLTGAAFDAGEALHKEREAAKSAWFEFISEFGGAGAKPLRDGGMYCVLFPKDKLPDGWRSLGRVDGGIAGAPRKNTKAGKALHARMEALPKVHYYIEAVRRIAPDVANATTYGDSYIRFATCERLVLPEVSYVLSVPRTLGDGLDIPSEFMPITPREYEQAFHDHNEAVKARKEAAA